MLNSNENFYNSIPEEAKRKFDRINYYLNGYMWEIDWALFIRDLETDRELCEYFWMYKNLKTIKQTHNVQWWVWDWTLNESIISHIWKMVDNKKEQLWMEYIDEVYKILQVSKPPTEIEKLKNSLSAVLYKLLHWLWFLPRNRSDE